MIVETDFFTHWKTELLVSLTGDPAAPLKLLKLWAYCQSRRCFEFNNLTPQRLSAICGFDGDPAKIYHILKSECGFIDEVERNGEILVKVHDWDVVNAKLIASWKNGALGGRPRKSHKPEHNPSITREEPERNPRGIVKKDDLYITQEEPEHNPSITREEPKPNPRITDREDREDREDRKDREEKKEKEEEKEFSSSTSSSFLGKVFRRGRRKSQRVEENTEQMIRIGSWFGRREDTLWQAEEAAALAALGVMPESEMELLEWWFLEAGDGDAGDKNDERNYRRRQIPQLLNNWSGEIDRANKFKRSDDLIGQHSDIPEM